MTAQPPSFMGHRGGGHSVPWSNLYNPYLDNDISMASLQSQPTTSGMSGLQGSYDAPFSPYPGPYTGPWPHNPTLHAQRIGSNVNSARVRKDNDAKHVMMAFRDDQFGQILEAISPSKKQRDKMNGLPSQHYRTRQQEQSHRPPKMAALSVPVRPSSAAIARSTASSDLTAALQKCARRPSSDQENFSAKAPVKRSSHTSYHDGKKDDYHSRVPELNPFVREPQRWDSDVSMRDGSSNLSSHAKHSRRPTSLGSRLASAHAPSAIGDIRGRKEGLAVNATDFLNKDTRHDQSLLLAYDADSITRARPPSDDADRTRRERPRSRHSGVSGQAEIIDVDAIDPNLAEEATADLAKLSPFEPGHKASMSSISSTGRLERQLYSALGEELGSFEQQINADGMGPELAQALSGTATRNVRKSSAALDPTVREFEPAVKRKRRGTPSGEADSSPIKKKDKAQRAMVEDDDIPEDMPQLRGD
ncbi:hypothetical protein E8E13_008859 [Curvularia kusanoi]|uniref:Uncharacterized protein n=1 Tax=Curvularia kusanoi TaxID=90978 RepID=A0A9P4TF19_CURKU|nr:hypothetical protein E8E13_008859 [Curvularia kusanoi]